MKRLVYCLFALAAMVVALSPMNSRAEVTRDWILVAILFQGNEVMNSKIFGGISNEAECKKAMKDLAAEAKAANVEIWSGCLEIVREKNLGDPKTKQKS
jgi:hypothetical protein